MIQLFDLACRRPLLIAPEGIEITVRLLNTYTKKNF